MTRKKELTEGEIRTLMEILPHRSSNGGVFVPLSPFERDSLCRLALSQPVPKEAGGLLEAAKAMAATGATAVHVVELIRAFIENNAAPRVDSPMGIASCETPGTQRAGAAPSPTSERNDHGGSSDLPRVGAAPTPEDCVVGDDSKSAALRRIAAHEPRKHIGRSRSFINWQNAYEEIKFIAIKEMRAAAPAKDDAAPRCKGTWNERPGEYAAATFFCAEHPDIRDDRLCPVAAPAKDRHE